MTRTQTRTYGVINPSTRQPLLEAMLCAFAWLVSNVVSTLATIFNRNTRDWHTGDAEEDQLPKSDDLRTPKPILRDDRFAIPQDEAGGRSTESRSHTKHHSTQALILRDLRKAQIVSKEFDVTCAAGDLVRGTKSNIGRGLTALSTRMTRHTHSLSPRKSRSGYPGPIRSREESAKWFPARAALGRDDKRERNLSLI